MHVGEGETNPLSRVDGPPGMREGEGVPVNGGWCSVSRPLGMCCLGWLVMDTVGPCTVDAEQVPQEWGSG